jgi:hypothetical protein
MIQLLFQILVIAVLDHIIERVLCRNNESSSNELLVENPGNTNVDDLNKLIAHERAVASVLH